MTRTPSSCSAEPGRQIGVERKLATTRRPWAELVFHVLAHVRSTASLPSSAYDPVYAGYVANHLGPAANRHLGEDAALLGAVVRDHATLARLQLVAWLFQDAEQAALVRDRDLSSLDPDTLLDSGARDALRACEEPAEILRAAAELEASHYARLPEWRREPEPLSRALLDVLPAAPFLDRCTVECVPPLRLRGRVRRQRIWVGLPCPELSVTPSHVAWQAGHEATVAELAERCRGAALAIAERDVEHAAVVLFAERAASAGLESEHRAWFSHLSPGAQCTSRGSLSATARAALALCESSQ